MINVEIRKPGHPLAIVAENINWEVAQELRFKYQDQGFTVYFKFN